MKKIMTIAAAALLTALSPAATSHAAFAVVARWDFNECSPIHADTSGNNLTATSGSQVINCATFGGAVGIRTPWIPNHSSPPTSPERLTRVAHTPLLNPDGAPFAVTVRFRQTQNYGNIIQKGQSGSKGGYWKWEMPNGQITCLFRGSLGSKAVKSNPNILLNDGQWHTVRCERNGTLVTMKVDAQPLRKGTGPTGVIANTKELTISGKGSCNQTTVTCDYFAGDIDLVQIEKG